MAPEVLVALITSGVGLALSVANVSISYLIAKRAKRVQDLDAMASYRDPLLWAIHDLRSRTRTILGENFLTRYIVESAETASAGDVFLHRYARRHTLFVLAQYLGWAEILRQEVGFLNLGSRRRNRILMEHISVVRRVLFATDLDPVFHVPVGQQAAIGELMMEGDDRAHGRALRCLGFAGFCARLDKDQAFAEWFVRIQEGLEDFVHKGGQSSDRLQALNKHLTEFIDFLDPDLSRFPLRQRTESAYGTGSASGNERDHERGLKIIK